MLATHVKLSVQYKTKVYNRFCTCKLYPAITTEDEIFKLKDGSEYEVGTMLADEELDPYREDTEFEDDEFDEHLEFKGTTGFCQTCKKFMVHCEKGELISGVAIVIT